MVAHKNMNSRSSSTSFNKSFSSSFIQSKSYGSVMQTHPYALSFNKKSQKTTIFDKLYKTTPLKSGNKIEKIRNRKRITELDRCIDMKQREKYNLLLEQHRREATIKLSSKNLTNSAKSTPVKRNIPVINLTGDTPIPSIRKRFFNKPLLNTKCTNGNKNNGLPSPFQQPSSLEKLYSFNSSLGLTTSTPTVSSSEKSWPTSSLTQKENNSTKEKQSASISMASVTAPFSRSTNVEWMSKRSSPYLSESFISDLIGTYGRKERERKRLVAEEETRARLLRERKKMKDDFLAKLLTKKLQVQEEVIAELSSEIEASVDNALFPHPGPQVLVEKFNISITREHMQTLAGLNWLNDEIINYYMEMIVDRAKMAENLPSIHAMNTFFYPKLVTQNYKSVRRWTKKVDIFSKDLILYPIHLGVHWTLAVIDFRSKEISYYDSMGGTNEKCLYALKEYLNSEHLDKKKSAYDTSEWKMINKLATDIPQQMNGSDCGVFTCTFAEFVARKSPLTFQQKDMPLIRRTMVWEILNSKLTR